MWLRRVELRNFQCHREAAFDLTPGMNVVVGSTDSGKSALVRAIRWAAFNRPLGDAFRDGYEDPTRVTLILDDETRVIREKGRRLNRYTVIKIDGSEQSWTDFGRDAPDVVSEVLGFRPVDLGGGSIELNVQSQHDPPFMVGWRPKDRAEVIEKMAGNDILIRLVGDLNREVNSAGQSIGKLGARAKDIEEAMAGFGDLGAKRRALDEAQWKLGQADEAGQSVANLESIALDLERIDVRLGQADALHLAAIPDVEPIQDRANASAAWRAIASGLEEADLALKDSEAFRVPEVDLAALEAREALYSAWIETCSGLEEVEVGLKASAVALVENESLMGALAEERSTVLAELGECPLCGGLTNGKD